MPGLKRVKLNSVQRQATELIKAYILESKFKPGDRLPTEEEFGEQLGVSRTVVREALSGLESAGFVYSRQGAGRFVGTFSIDSFLETLGYGMRLDLEDYEDLLEVRKWLEVSSMGQAIAKMDAGTLAQLRDLVATMKNKAARSEEFLREDIDFHRQLCLVTGNRLLMKLLTVMWEIYPYAPEDPRHATLDLPHVAQMHENILNAIEARDTTLSQRLIAENIEFVQNWYRKPDGESTAQPDALREHVTQG